MNSAPAPGVLQTVQNQSQIAAIGQKHVRWKIGGLRLPQCAVTAETPLAEELDPAKLLT
ncbi:MAG: hypothetical protein SFV51_22155 [Bryobacteraceae bacterium]|nr:hypothetical protein [Bryobacteraceae bacterium]